MPVPCGGDLPNFDYEEHLSLPMVRRAAADADLDEISFSDALKLCVFASRDQPDNAARTVAVYYSTGTVGVSYDHPIDGRVETFRRHVGMQALRLILRERTRSCGCHDQDRRKQPRYAANYEQPTTPRVNHLRSEASEVTATVTRLRRELKEAEDILADEQHRRDEVARREAELRRREEEERQRAEAERQRAAAAQAAAAEEERQRQAAAQAAAAEEERQRQAAAQAAAIAEAARQEKVRVRNARGTRYKFWCAHAEDVDKNMRDDCTCVAINGTAAIFLYEGGGWAYTANLCTNLFKKLNGRSINHPSPLYVAMGTMDRYYIRFANGKSEWAGCDCMSEELNSTSRAVKTVAFGRTFESHFIVYEDGGWSYMGDIPDGLQKQIEKRDKRADLACVSLGPDGEWYLKARNGKAWWNGLSQRKPQLRRHPKGREQQRDVHGIWSQRRLLDPLHVSTLRAYAYICKDARAGCSGGCRIHT